MTSDVKKDGPFIRTPYNYDMDYASDVSGLACEDKSLTLQSQLEESDINTIIARFGLGYQMPDNIRAPQYGDFTGVGDFQSALNAVNEARESFMAMPAQVRARFHNDPQELVEFLGDPENRQEAAKMGLLKPVEPDPLPPQPVLVKIAPEPSK